MNFHPALVETLARAMHGARDYGEWATVAYMWRHSATILLACLGKARPDAAAVLTGDAVAIPAEQWQAAFGALSTLRAAHALGQLPESAAAETERLVALFNSKIQAPAP